MAVVRTMRTRRLALSQDYLGRMGAFDRRSRTGKRRKRMKRSRLAAMLGGLALLGALTVGSVSSVFGATEWATVTGYAEGSSGNNNPEAWGDDCWKLNEPNVSTYVLAHDYDLVIVKAGSEQSAPGHVNTLFDSAKA